MRVAEMLKLDSPTVVTENQGTRPDKTVAPGDNRGKTAAVPLSRSYLFNRNQIKARRLGCVPADRDDCGIIVGRDCIRAPRSHKHLPSNGIASIAQPHLDVGTPPCHMTVRHDVNPVLVAGGNKPAAYTGRSEPLNSAGVSVQYSRPFYSFWD